MWWGTASLAPNGELYFQFSHTHMQIIFEVLNASDNKVRCGCEAAPRANNSLSGIRLESVCFLIIVLKLCRGAAFTPCMWASGALKAACWRHSAQWFSNCFSSSSMIKLIYNYFNNQVTVWNHCLTWNRPNPLISASQCKLAIVIIIIWTSTS